MSETLKIAWRSLGRHRRRSAITVSAIGFALMVAIVFISIAEGIYGQMIRDAVRIYTGHITLEHPEFLDAPAIDLSIEITPNLRQSLQANRNIDQLKPMITAPAVLKTGTQAVGVFIAGVVPDVERNLSPVAHRIQDGDYLNTNDSPRIVIGRDLAERLHVKPGKKVVLAANNVSGELVEELLRVAGVFAIGSDEVDGYYAQIPIETARRIYGMPEHHVSQLGILVNNANHRDITLNEVRDSVGQGVTTRPWEEELPELSAYVKIDRASNWILQAILLFLSLFTIANTIVMSVLERTHEFAVVLALGTPQRQLRLQVVIESFILGCLGIVAGTLLGGAIALYLEIEGLDIRFLLNGGMSVSGFAIDTMMHADLQLRTVLFLSGVVVLTTLIISAWSTQRISRIDLARVLR